MELHQSELNVQRLCNYYITVLLAVLLYIMIDPTTADALGLAEALVLHGELVMVDVTELGCKEAK